MGLHRYNVPAVYAGTIFARDGGLLSYGVDLVDPWRRAASYVDRILRGAKPTELPVQLPTKFEMVLNLKTAKALGLAVPPSILLRADQVIEAWDAGGEVCFRWKKRTRNARAAIHTVTLSAAEPAARRRNVRRGRFIRSLTAQAGPGSAGARPTARRKQALTLAIGRYDPPPRALWRNR